MIHSTSRRTLTETKSASRTPVGESSRHMARMPSRGMDPVSPTHLPICHPVPMCQSVQWSRCKNQVHRRTCCQVDLLLQSQLANQSNGLLVGISPVTSASAPWRRVRRRRSLIRLCTSDGIGVRRSGIAVCGVWERRPKVAVLGKCSARRAGEQQNG